MTHRRQLVVMSGATDADVESLFPHPRSTPLGGMDACTPVVEGNWQGVGLDPGCDHS